MARHFTEAEAQHVFARAAELQRASPGTEAGLTLGDLEEAARAAGLDPALVATAAAELDALPTRRTMVGAPVEVTRSRHIAGDVTDEAWGAIVAELRRTFRVPGVVGGYGRTREWSNVGGLRNDMPLTVSIEPEGDGVRVSLTRSARQQALGSHIPAGIQGTMALVFSLVALISGEPGFWIPALILLVMSTLFLSAGQIGLRLWANRQETKFDALLDRIDRIARDETPTERTDERSTPHRAVSERPTRVSSSLLDSEPDEALEEGRLDNRLFDEDAPEDDVLRRASTRRSRS